MSKFKVEIQITLITVIIAAVVITTGYFAYKSLSQIVLTVQKNTRPDNRLFLMKDISNELGALENKVRLYSLTRNRSDLQQYDTLQANIILRIEELSELPVPDSVDRVISDSVVHLSMQKLRLWNDILLLHLSAKDESPRFSELYSKLEEQKTDTIIDEILVPVEPAEKKGFFRKIFGGKDQPPATTTIRDTTFVQRDIAKDSIREEIRNLETEIAEKDRQLNLRESRLIAKNIIITNNLNRLISEAEIREADSLTEKTKQADALAELTYKRLAVFTIVSVVLLIIALFVLFNYLRKSRNYQLALQRAKAEAENLAKAREQFASNVSHEMRTPVNAIFGLAEQLLQQPVDEQIREQVAVIASSAGHLKNIINDTLDFSKIQSQKLKIDTLHFSPERVFAEVITLQQNDANKKGIELRFEKTGELPEALIGDPVRLKQVLLNLIGNAIKFTDEGTVSLKVRSIPKKYRMHHLEMVVSDTGIGIPAENLKDVFDEFVQVENQSGKKYSGTGLGLAIVKKLVELQKGHIDIASQPGTGTVVTVTIPYFEGKTENIKEPEIEKVEIPEWMKAHKVLIADDEEFNRFVIKAILKKWGLPFGEARNGHEAVEMGVHGNFDLILMDIRMPGKNGMEATKEILSQRPDISIIAVSAANELTDREKCLSAGMKDFLLKPFSEKELFDKISAVLLPVSPKNTNERQPEINLDEARRLAGGDEAFLSEMIQLFLKSTVNGLGEIHKSLEKQNHEAIAEACHKMAAPCKHFHATTLYNLLKQIEDLAKNKASWDEITVLIKKLETGVAGVQKFFKNVTL